ncbi:MAG: NADH-quinone oxidoreductase subunit D [Verrucomicrobiae bacterium]|nr:NADH-quinone oxidoreductase subunit D [Verrucomicrobiae bacterium]
MIETQPFEVAIGPQHPSTHGVFRMNVTLDGETVIALKPVMGYLHRNHEQLAEKMTWLGSMPYTDRLDYFNSMANNWAYALAVEKLAGIKVPERAEYIRVIMGEMTRLLNHACVIGFLLQDLGAWGTPLLYAFREREKILDFFEAVSGSRMMCNYFRFGGVRVDLTDAMIQQAKDIVARFPRFLDEFEELLSANELLLARTQNVGILPKELAINASITGPMARASGVEYDVRKVDQYGIYNRFDFRVPLGEVGDVYDRYYVRLLEMRESVKILQQALRDLPPGPVQAPEVKLRNFKVPKGDGYGRIESPKGELGFYLVADDTGKQPYRYHVRPPSFINLTILEDMCLGHKVADVVIILGSVDIVLGEVDR